MLEYKQEIPEMTDLLALYSSVGWTNYTNNPAMLEEAVKASLWQLAVYDEEELVAYIRLVGDGHSVIFVQKLKKDTEVIRIGKPRAGRGRLFDSTEILATEARQLFLQLSQLEDIFLCSFIMVIVTVFHVPSIPQDHSEPQ